MTLLDKDTLAKLELMLELYNDDYILTSMIQDCIDRIKAKY